VIFTIVCISWNYKSFKNQVFWDITPRWKVKDVSEDFITSFFWVQQVQPALPKKNLHLKKHRCQNTKTRKFKHIIRLTSYIYTHNSTRNIFFANVVVTQSVNKFLFFNETRKFMTVLTTARLIEYVVILRQPIYRYYLISDW